MERYPPSFYTQPRFPPHQQNPNVKQPEEPSKKIFWILGAVLFVIIGALMYILLIAPSSGESSGESLGGESQPTPQSQSIVSCENWNCFVDASENCNQANFTNTLSVDFFGVNITGITYYELKGIEDSQCTFYLRTEEAHISYTNELKQQMLDSGLTQEEIEQAEQQTNEQYNLLEGRDGQCTIETSDLTPLLTGWKDGNFSGGTSCSLTDSGKWECEYTGDWEVFSNCEGDYFSSEGNF